MCPVLLQLKQAPPKPPPLRPSLRSPSGQSLAMCPVLLQLKQAPPPPPLLSSLRSSLRSLPNPPRLSPNPPRLSPNDLPPPPPRPSSRARACSTFISCPSISVPFSLSIAASTPSWSSMVTKANPLSSQKYQCQTNYTYKLFHKQPLTAFSYEPAK